MRTTRREDQNDQKKNAITSNADEPDRPAASDNANEETSDQETLALQKPHHFRALCFIWKHTHYHSRHQRASPHSDRERDVLVRFRGLRDINLFVALHARPSAAAQL